MWHFGADPDPTPFFTDFKDAKTIFFSYYFLITCPQVHHLQSKKFNFLLKFCLKMLFCRHCFSSLNTFMRKGKDPKPDPDPYLWLMDTDPDGPKTCGSCGSGSPTLIWKYNSSTHFSWPVYTVNNCALVLSMVTMLSTYLRCLDLKPHSPQQWKNFFRDWPLSQVSFWKNKKSFYITSRVAIQLANPLLSSRNVKYLIMQIHKFTLRFRSTKIEIMAARWCGSRSSLLLCCRSSFYFSLWCRSRSGYPK